MRRRRRRGTGRVQKNRGDGGLHPHWSVYPKGNEWFHPGWTEWEFARTAKPRFPGHKMPFKPLPGYLDGKDPTDVSTEIELASNAGRRVVVIVIRRYIP